MHRLCLGHDRLIQFTAARSDVTRVRRKTRGYEQPEGGTIPADGEYVPFCPRITRGRAVNEERKALLRKEGSMTGIGEGEVRGAQLCKTSKAGAALVVVMQAKTKAGPAP